MGRTPCFAVNLGETLWLQNSQALEEDLNIDAVLNGHIAKVPSKCVYVLRLVILSALAEWFW